MLLSAVESGHEHAGLDPFADAEDERAVGESLHQQALTVLLRLVFAAHLEQRGLHQSADGANAAVCSLEQLHRQLAAVDSAERERCYGGWPNLQRYFHSLHIRFGQNRHARFSLFDANATHLVDGPATDARWINDASLLAVLDALIGKRSQHSRDAQELGSIYEIAMGGRVVRDKGGRWTTSLGSARRSSGSHYTPATLTQEVVREGLRPHFRNGANNDPASLLTLRVCDPAMGGGAFLLEACAQLAQQLTRAWKNSNAPEALLPAISQRRLARYMVTRHCLFGVDVNPCAAELARLSLWLFCETNELALSLLDHTLVSGNSLLGLTRQQLEHNHWAPPRDNASDTLSSTLTRAAHAQRQAVTAASDNDRNGHITTLTATLRPLTRQAREVFEAFEKKSRKSPEQAVKWGCFHWPLAFPGVFAAANPGFDVIVGNPPFLGGKRISTAHGGAFAAWLCAIHKSSKNVDLAAHFLRRAARLLAPGGTVGFITTNTLPQGATRRDGLQCLLAEGFSIYHAVRSRSWPGAAAVKISVVCLAHPARPKATLLPKTLDGQQVAAVNSLLRAGPELADPSRLRRSRGFCFIGCFLRGAGFVLDDADGKALRSNAALRPVIRPFIGGEEVNHSPTHQPHRYVVDFGAMPLAEAKHYGEAVALLEQRVKPRRDALRDHGVDRGHKRRWWQFANPRPEMRAAIAGFSQCLVAPRVTKHLTFALVPTSQVFSDQLCVFATDDHAHFAILQSRVHDAWVRRYASTLGEGLRYTPSDCVETFAFPNGANLTDGGALPQTLRDAGQRLYHERSQLLRLRNEGLTKLYNALRDPNTDDPAMLRLRYLHEQLDKAVLEAYGWGDITPAPYARSSGASEQSFYQTLVERLHQLNRRSAKAA